MTLIDKAKTNEILNESCCGWDDTWTWSIINTTIDQEGVYEGTVEELVYIQMQLGRCIAAMKRNKDKITTEEP